MPILSPVEQPPRRDGDPGPDWLPRFGWKQAARWMLEGVLLPTAIYLAVWIIAALWSLMADGWPFYEDAFRTGGMFAILGAFLSGGTIVLTKLFSRGARWSTLFRIIGFTLAIILQWEISGWLLDQW